MKGIFVKDILKEQEVKDYFVVLKKGIYSTKNNTKFMSIRLRDASGQIEGKVWERVEELSANFDQNDVVYLESRARPYQGNMQLNITNIRKETGGLSGVAIKDFYPESGPGTERLQEDFLRITGEIKNPYLKALLDELRAMKESFEKYCLYPASVGIHHVSVGGLLHHSISMAEMARGTADLTGGDPDLIVTGALLHDVGKIEELTFEGGFRYSNRGRLLGHITLGIMFLDDLISKVEGFPDYLTDALHHILLSHHGEQEWGSPKKPMCIEAIVVHYLDNLDAKLMGVKEFMDENMEDEKWTQYHKIYESRFFKVLEG